MGPMGPMGPLGPRQGSSLVVVGSGGSGVIVFVLLLFQWLLVSVPFLILW